MSRVSCSNQLFYLSESVDVHLLFDVLQLVQLLVQFRVVSSHYLLASDHVNMKVVLAHNALHDLLQHDQRTTDSLRHDYLLKHS